MSQREAIQQIRLILHRAAVLEAKLARIPVEHHCNVLRVKSDARELHHVARYETVSRLTKLQVQHLQRLLRQLDELEAMVTA